MTLCTNIRVMEPYPVQDVLNACTAIIGAEQPRQSHEAASWAPLMVLMNKPLQGLPAWLIVRYAPDGPMEPEYDGDIAGGAFTLAMDTAYSYEGPNRSHCGDLHAWLIQEIGQWLTDHRLTWFWQNEYTGEWFPSSVAPTALGDPEKGRLLQPCS